MEEGAGAVSGARSSASLGEKGRPGKGGVDIVRKRGLTRDACPGEAITRRAAGAGHERGPRSSPCLLHRAAVPCAFLRAPKSPSGGVEPPRRLNLPASASNLVSPPPPL